MGEIREDHGPDCSCGCHDHGHEHGHANESGHGHSHAHAQERIVDFVWAEAALESHVHDQAATVSTTLHVRQDAGKAFGALVESLQSIAKQVESAGGIVGHIKAYARAGESFAHASATDAQHAPACEGDARLPLGPDVQCQLVAIALLIDLEQLERIVISALE